MFIGRSQVRVKQGLSRADSTGKEQGRKSTHRRQSNLPCILSTKQDQTQGLIDRHEGLLSNRYQALLTTFNSIAKLKVTLFSKNTRCTTTP